jgi:adenylate cyclase
MASINVLLSEFRARKIGQTIIVYLGSAWVLLEAFGFFAQRYGWPPQSIDCFLVILVFGLPATVTIRWFQDSPPESSKRIPFYILSLSAVLALFFVTRIWNASPHVALKSSTKSERSIAVLPFTNLSRDPDQEYFSDGMTEDIISKLYKISNLHVTSRTSVLMYKNTTKTINQIADELGVMYILEGSVQRANNQVRIIARLIKAGDDENVWTNSFDNELSDVFKVQSDVAQKIAEELKIQLTQSEQQRIQKAPTANTLAYEFYQQGLFFSNQGPSLSNVESSKNFFEKAIQLDSGFVMAYTALAETYITFMDWGYAAPGDVLPQALKFGRKALQLDSMSGEAYAAIGAFHIYSTHNYALARQSLEKAIALNPACDIAYYRYTILNWCLRNKEQAYKSIDKAIELNPVSLRTNGYRVQTYYLFREYDLALNESERLLTIFPADNFVLWLRGTIFTNKGEYAKAIESFLKRSVPTKDTNWALGYAYAKSGQTEKAKKIAEYLVEKSKTRYIPPSFIGIIYLGMNDLDKAFTYFEKGAAVNDYWLTTYDVEPWFDQIRDDPRFKAIQAKLLFRAADNLNM